MLFNDFMQQTSRQFECFYFSLGKPYFNIPYPSPCMASYSHIVLPPSTWYRIPISFPLCYFIQNNFPLGKAFSHFNISYHFSWYRIPISFHLVSYSHIVSQPSPWYHFPSVYDSTFLTSNFITFCEHL